MTDQTTAAGDPFVLGARIKELRLAAGLNKSQLAQRSGVSDVTIFYWESGEITQIGHLRLLALCQALGCTVSAFLQDDRPANPGEHTVSMTQAELDRLKYSWQAASLEEMASRHSTLDAHTLRAEAGRLRHLARTTTDQGETVEHITDEVVEEFELLKSEMGDLQRKYDEMAVHMDRLRLALDNVLHEVGTHSHDDLSDDERAALAALDAAPTTSFIRRDLTQQAEALEQRARLFRQWAADFSPAKPGEHLDFMSAPRTLERDARELRRRAYEAE